MYISSATKLGQASLQIGAPPSAGDTQLIQNELDRGNRDPNQLTNLVFFAHHPDRGGRKIDRNERDFQKLRQEWLDIRDKLVRPALESSAGKPPQLRPASCPGATWLLEYEGSPQRNRCIETTDQELSNNYIDWNIVDSQSIVDISAQKILSWKIIYKDGRSKMLDPNAVPVIKPSPPTRLQISLLSHYLMKTDGFIYPMYNTNIRYDWVQTPVLMELRYAVDARLKALHDLQRLIFIGASFAKIIGLNSSISSINPIK